MRLASRPRKGNVLLEGIIGVQKEAVLAARRSIVTVEEVVDDFAGRARQRHHPAAWTVAAIAVVPGGAFPPMRMAITGATTRSISPGTPIARDREQFRRVDEGERARMPGRKPSRSASRGAGGGMSDTAGFTPTEMMTIAAARALTNDDVCFVGIGAPSAACNRRAPHPRARHHADLRKRHHRHAARTCCRCRSATASSARRRSPPSRCPEMFRYWLQGGRITVGFLGGAQIDRFANLNTTVVGDYDKPKVRLPGGGGAPEIARIAARSSSPWRWASAALSRSCLSSPRSAMAKAATTGQRLGIKTQGTDAAHHRSLRLEPDPVTQGIDCGLAPSRRRRARRSQDECGWPVRFADSVVETPPPTAARTRRAARSSRAHRTRPTQAD